ncbi:MAG: WYL domain-containing protein, partial [Candidatus Margulisiibacteriota bacterium]
GAWYLLGYHEEQKVMKTYRIRRLTRVRKLKDCFDLLTLPKEVSTAIPASEITLVKTRFSHKIADTLIDRLEGLEDKMVKNAKGDLVVEIPTADVDTTYSWLLSFGSLVEVLEPLSLRVRFRKDLVAMISMY